MEQTKSNKKKSTTKAPPSDQDKKSQNDVESLLTDIVQYFKQQPVSSAISDLEMQTLYGKILIDMPIEYLSAISPLDEEELTERLVTLKRIVKSAESVITYLRSVNKSTKYSAFTNQYQSFITKAVEIATEDIYPLISNEEKGDKK